MTKDERSFGLLVLHLVTNGQFADFMRLDSSRLFRVEISARIFVKTKVFRIG